jgi:hypothetical protein
MDAVVELQGDVVVVEYKISNDKEQTVKKHTSVTENRIYIQQIYQRSQVK